MFSRLIAYSINLCNLYIAFARDFLTTYGVTLGKTVHLVKLCVGIDSVEQLRDWRAAQMATNPNYISRHVTRMWPKRADEILNGGSLYWVIKGQIQARQTIVALDEVIGDDGIRRCGIRMTPDLIRTQIAPRRAFQGWRYLTTTDAPPDLPQKRLGDTDLPPELAAALADIGLK